MAEHESRKTIAIDASDISKAGKKTPYIGKFWSGCASSMKRGLEILGIGIVDVDARDINDYYRIRFQIEFVFRRTFNTKLIKEFFRLVADAA